MWPAMARMHNPRGLAGGGGDHAAGHGALGGPGLRGAERRREVPAAGRLPAVAGRAGLLGRAAHQLRSVILRVCLRQRGPSGQTF